MKTWACYCGGLLVAGGLATGASGQAPAIPGAPAAAGAAAGAAAPAAGAAAGQAAGLGGRLKAFCADCKEKFCNSQLGALVTNSVQPLNALTGGILGTCCPPGPPAADLAKPPTSAEGAAARIAKDTAEAKARRAAVRYLGTVDCNWWPEAEAGLINALRVDRNECVRYEAALALGRGCCCTQKIIRALSICVAEGYSDGHPSENSERVKAAAQFALENCLAKLCVVLEVEAGPGGGEKPREKPREVPKESPKENKENSVNKDAEAKKVDGIFPPYYQQLQNKPTKELIEEVRQALDKSKAAPSMMAMQRERPNSLSEIVTQAWSDGGVSDKAPGYVAQPMPTTAPPMATVMQPSKAGMEQPAGTKPVRLMPEQTGTVKPAPGAEKPNLMQQLGARPMTNEPGRAMVPAPRPGMEAPRSIEPSKVMARPTEMPRPATRPMEGTPSTRVIDVPKLPVRNETVHPATFQPSPGLNRPVPAPTTMPPNTSAAPRPAGTAPGMQVAAATLAMPSSESETRLRQALHAIKHSTYPEHREWAATQLSSSELRGSSQVIPALMTAAREDKEAAVRCACVRALGKMNANMPAVTTMLQALKSDSDARVRQEANLVLAKFGMGPSGFAEQAQPRAGLR